MFLLIIFITFFSLSTQQLLAENNVLLKKPLAFKKLDGCINHRGILRLAHIYGQGDNDRRIVLEAEENFTSNIGAEGTTGPFSSSEQNVIIEDQTAGAKKYNTFARKAKWERADWKIVVDRSETLTGWFRVATGKSGEYSYQTWINKTHSGRKTIGVVKPASLNTTLDKWVWIKGETYTFSTGENIFTLDWHNGLPLDQIAFLPANVVPPNTSLQPTYFEAVHAGTATTAPLILENNETPLKLLSRSFTGGGSIRWEVTDQKSEKWLQIPSDGCMKSLNLQQGKPLIFRVKLIEGPSHSSPMVENTFIELSKSERTVDLATIPQKMVYSPQTIDLVPSDWNGVRWNNDVWSLTSAFQPDTNGIIRISAVNAHFSDILPEERSWIERVEGSFSKQVIRQGLWNRNFFSYDIFVPGKKTFIPWFRVKLARGKVAYTYQPEVTLQIDAQTMKKNKLKCIAGTDWRKHEWIWLSGDKLELDSGCQTFRIRAGLDYFWLDRIVLVPENITGPPDKKGEIVRKTVPEGEISFQPITWPSVKKWREIITNYHRHSGQLNFLWTSDHGKNWTAFDPNKVGTIHEYIKNTINPVRIKCIIKPDKDGNSPQITEWNLAFSKPKNFLIQLGNKTQKILFDAKRASLMGWWTASSGWIIPPGQNQPLFRIGTQGRVLKAGNSRLVKQRIMDKNRQLSLELQYLLEGGTVIVEFRIELPDDGLAHWSMKIQNNSQVYLSGTEFPIISGVRIGNEPEANRAPSVDAFSGEGSGAIFCPVPGYSNPHSGLYPGWTNMGWYTLHDANGKNAFTLQTRDRHGYHIWMRQKKDPNSLGMEYVFTNTYVIAPQSTAEITYDIGWHQGDWHQSAEYYRKWADSWMKFTKSPKWVKYCDGWLDPGVSIASRYITHGWPVMDWYGANYSQGFARAVDGTISCTPFPVINPRLGIAEDFRKAHNECREKGWHWTYYLQKGLAADSLLEKEFIGPTPTRLLPDGLILPGKGFVEKYGKRNQLGNLVLSGWCGSTHYPIRTYPMCAASGEWINMQTQGMCHNYGQILGADGIYLDTTGLSGQFCFCSAHDHGCQTGIYAVGMNEILHRTIEQGRKNNPDFALAIEGNMDQFMRYVSFGLWYSKPYWDGNVFQYTFPEAKLIKGHRNGGGKGVLFGEYARYLSLFLVNDLIGSLNELKEFYSYRKRIGDWMHNGVFQDDVGLTVSKPGIEAKWFKRKDKEHIGVLVTIHNEDKISDAELTLKYPELKDVRKAFAYLWGGGLKVLDVKWNKDKAVVEIPDAQACGILFIAKAPDREAVRAYCDWPLTSGGDELKLVLVNTSVKDKELMLSYVLPNGVELHDAPEQLNIQACSMIEKKIPVHGIAKMKRRGKIIIKINYDNFCKEISCVLAPPLVNGGFEIDSVGNGTPDMWGRGGNRVLIHLLQNRKLPEIVQNKRGVIHHCDGFIDVGKPVEGKNCLKLPGFIKLPYFWCRKADDKSPVPVKPYYFETGQQLILKPGTDYELSFKYKHTGREGELNILSGVCEWPVKVTPAFAPRNVALTNAPGVWHTYTCSFRTVDDLAGQPYLRIINKSKNNVWLDDVKINLRQ